MPKIRFWRWGVILGLGLVAVLAAHGDETVRPDFIVATNGNDGWSGTLAAPAANGQDGPFKTLARAQTAVRALRKSEPARRGKFVVQVRGGTYPLTEPLVFTSEDSGTADAPVVYLAAPGEQPVFSGGVTLTGWRVDQAGRWVLELPDVKTGTWNFTQLFVNGQRRYRPRLPKEGYYFTAGELPPSEQAKAKGPGDDRFRFRLGELRSNWSNLNDVEVMAFQTWTMARLRVAAIDENDRVVTFTGTTRGRQSYQKLAMGRRYFVENVKEALSAPGEWYLDRQTGTLTYLPKPGEDRAQAEIIAPRTETLVKIAGDVAGKRFVEHLVFQGLTFAHANWTTPPQGNSFPQAEVNLGAAIEAVGARDCALVGCKVEHIGMYAISWGEGCKRNETRDCVLADLGAGGIKIGETTLKGEESQASHNTVRNCLIAAGGRLHPAAVGIWIGHAHDNVVENCTIRDLYYSGLSVGWSWGYGPSGAHHNRFEANHVHTIGQEVLSDMGALYSLGVSPGTTLKGNHFHDVNPFDYGGWGIYFDEGSAGIVAEGNVVYRCKTGSFHQHYGKENVLERNFFVDSPGPQLARTRSEPHISFFFRHNVVAYTAGTLLGGNWQDDDKYAIDENLYWHRGEPVLFGKDDLAAWRKRGHDQHSIVADPKFVDWAHDDFRLQPGSPASKIGCPSIDVRAAGCALPEERAGAYGSEARAFPPPPPPQPIADDFEDTPLGEKAALGMTHEENNQSVVRVMDETAAEGRHSLKFTDGPGRKQCFNPHLHYPAKFTEGKLIDRFALRRECGAVVFHEWRDAENPYHVGPAIYVDADGTLRTRQRWLGTISEEKWVEFRIDCGLERPAGRGFALDVRLPGAAKSIA